MKQGVTQIRYGIIADDLTGATDTAATFAGCGFTVAVALEARRLRSLAAQVVVLSTHSRHDIPATARRKVRRACAQLRQDGFSIAYKKLDSTGQGNIVAEVEAARNAGGFVAALVCPANPTQGRIVRGGVLRVRGGKAVKLQELFCLQGLTGGGSIAAPISAVKVSRATGQGHRFLVADATNQRDLACLARVAVESTPRILLAGSAGMASELAKLLKVGASIRRNRDVGLSPARAGQSGGGRTIVVTGSNNPVTARQLNRLIEMTHAASFALNPGTTKHASAALASERNVIIRVPVHRQADEVVLRKLCAVVAPLLRTRLVHSFILTGGDTALLVCRCLRPRAIEIRGEIVPGLAWGRFVGGLADGLTVCTKPGGFGNNQSLVRAVDFLARVTANAGHDGIPFRTPRNFSASRNRVVRPSTARKDHTTA